MQWGCRGRRGGGGSGAVCSGRPRAPPLAHRTGPGLCRPFAVVHGPDRVSAPAVCVVPVPVRHVPHPPLLPFRPPGPRKPRVRQDGKLVPGFTPPKGTVVNSGGGWARVTLQPIPVQVQVLQTHRHPPIPLLTTGKGCTTPPPPKGKRPQRLPRSGWTGGLRRLPNRFWGATDPPLSRRQNGASGFGLATDERLCDVLLRTCPCTATPRLGTRGVTPCLSGCLCLWVYLGVCARARPQPRPRELEGGVKRPRQQPAHPQYANYWATQTAHHATFSTAPTHQLLGSANAETTPGRAPAAAADRKQRPDATCEGTNG